MMTLLNRTYKLYDTLVVKRKFWIWDVLLAVLIYFKCTNKLYETLVVKCKFETLGVSLAVLTHLNRTYELFELRR